jgi:hypothetical protein
LFRYGRFKLHDMYKTDVKATAVNEGSSWIPIDHNVVTPFHEACSRVPGTFPPTLCVRGTLQLPLHVTTRFWGFFLADKINLEAVMIQKDHYLDPSFLCVQFMHVYRKACCLLCDLVHALMPLCCMRCRSAVPVVMT